MLSSLTWRSRGVRLWSTRSRPTSGRFRRSFRRGSWKFHPCQQDLKGLDEDVIPGLEMPSGTPLIYEIDADLEPIPNDFSSRLMEIPSVPS